MRFISSLNLLHITIAAALLGTMSASTIEKECTIKATVSCYITSNHRDCNDIQMRPKSCEDIDVSFGYRYCNLHRHNTITLISGEMKINDGDAFFEPLLDENELEPMNCKEWTKVFTVNTCTNKFQADMSVEGWINDDTLCASDDFYSYVKPLFQTMN